MAIFIDITYEIRRKPEWCSKDALFLVRRQLLPANWADIKAGGGIATAGQRIVHLHGYKGTIQAQSRLSFLFLLCVSVMSDSSTSSTLYSSTKRVIPSLFAKSIVSLLIFFLFLSFFFLVIESRRLGHSSVYDRLQSNSLVNSITWRDGCFNLMEQRLTIEILFYWSRCAFLAILHVYTCI